MSLNGPDNPFSAQGGSPLPAPPTHITAMVFDADGDTLVAFSNKDMYFYDIGNGDWMYVGIVATPCD